ncbi:membrane protein [Kineosporia sp. NBRC 101731]|nr:membrane protein [Kineosporia sp. NBRC 101731]
MVSERRPNETPSERADRNFGDLLQELRVTQTGVQILFAFLLTLPLQSRFESLDAWERDVYVASLLLSAMATVCLIAPVAYHRAVFSLHKKPLVVRVAARFAIGGLFFLALAICCAVDLVLDLVLGRGTALAITGGLALVLLATWVIFPLLQRVGDLPEDAAESTPPEDH